MTTDNVTAFAVQRIVDSLYFLDQKALMCRDLWRNAKILGDEKGISENLKLKVKVHNLKKQAVMQLCGQGFGKIKGYYECASVESRPHLLAVEICDREFLIPMKKKLSKNLIFLGEIGLIQAENGFESNLTIVDAFRLVNLYLNPNSEKERLERAKKRKKSDLTNKGKMHAVKKAPFKKAFPPIQAVA